MDALEAELEIDLQLAVQLWKRVLAVSPADNQALKALERIWGQPAQASQPPSQSKSSSNSPSKSAALPTFNFEVVTVDVKGKEVKREKRQAEYISENLGDGVTLEMVSIPAGSFVMGAPETEKDSYEDERPQHRVNVPSFFIGKYQVTQAQWRQVAAIPQVKTELNPNPSDFKGDNRPVERVSWLEVREFCARLSKHSGRDYRLPSEAEWEYACRAGTTTPFHFGKTITPEVVNYNANNPYGEEPKGEYRLQTTDVGSFSANAFGLYDMHGNAWEWCVDDCHSNYEGLPTNASIWINDIKNYEVTETLKVLRGGSWLNGARYCRSADRNWRDARCQHNNFGCRIALVLSS